MALLRATSDAEPVAQTEQVKLAWRRFSVTSQEITILVRLQTSGLPEGPVVAIPKAPIPACKN
jgi:hypothetical protein